MRALARSILSLVADMWARTANFSFPHKFTWKWKVDMLSGHYEHGTTILMKKILKPGMTVADIGAHIGYFTRLAARSVGTTGRVYAFEPEDENRALLVKNTRHFNTVSIENTAISDHSGTISFFRVPNSTGCHSTVRQEGAATTQVSATTLDAFLAARKISVVDVIKMDIEGGEWAALQGMEKTLSGRVHLILEYNPDALTHAGVAGEQMLEYLAERGFTVHAITRSGPVSLSAPYESTLRTHLPRNGSLNLYCTKI